MTYREKITQEQPEHIDSDCLGGVGGCPYVYGYESKNDSPCVKNNRKPGEIFCTSCWDREIPGTKKEKNMDVTNETMIDLMEELDDVKAELDYFKNREVELKEELNRLEKYKQYEKTANELKAMYTAFISAGFSNTQAFDMVKTITIGMIPAVLKNSH